MYYYQLKIGEKANYHISLCRSFEMSYYVQNFSSFIVHNCLSFAGLQRAGANFS